MGLSDMSAARSQQTRWWRGPPCAAPTHTPRGPRMTQQDHHRLYIGGGWTAPSSDRRITLTSPNTGEPIGSAPEAVDADADAAVGAARTAFGDPHGWARTTPDERASVLRGFAGALDARSGAIVEAVSSQNGMPKTAPSRRRSPSTPPSPTPSTPPSKPPVAVAAAQQSIVSPADADSVQDLTGAADPVRAPERPRSRPRKRHQAPSPLRCWGATSQSVMLGAQPCCPAQTVTRCHYAATTKYGELAVLRHPSDGRAML